MVIFVVFFHFILFAKKARICDFNVKYLKSQEKLANIKTQENIKYSIEEIRKKCHVNEKSIQIYTKKRAVNPVSTKNKLKA